MEESTLIYHITYIDLRYSMIKTLENCTIIQQNISFHKIDIGRFYQSSLVDLNKWRGNKNYLEGETRISSPITPEFLLQIPFQRI